MSFFDLPASAIDSAKLDAFLNELMPEGLNLDYKGELTATVYETVAAMANTYGGIVLVGVDEDKSHDPPLPLLPARGVNAGDRERLVNQAYTLLHPNFALDVVPVTAAGGGQVLVVRVDPARADRPIVFTRKDSHRVFIRLEGRNAEADRSRLAALFAEPPGAAAAVAVPSNFNLLNSGQRPIDNFDGPAVALRVAVEAAIPFERIDQAVIDTELRNRLDAVLPAAPIDEWINAITARVPLPTSGRWEPPRTGYTTSHSGLAVRRWRGAYALGGERTVEAPTGAQVAVQCPWLYSGGRVSVVVDATFEPGPVLSVIDDRTVPGELRLRFKDKLTLEDVYRGFLALIETALDVVAPTVFPEILGIPAWERIGPTGYLYAFRHSPMTDQLTGIGRFVDLATYVSDKVEPNLDIQGVNPFYLPRTAVFETHEERAEVVKAWLTRLLLDMGLEGFEPDLAAM